MPDRDETARDLAGRHYQLDDGITAIYRVVLPNDEENQPGEPIKLLEVNWHTVPAGILPIQFGPLPHVGIRFSSMIIEVSPEEFDELQAGRLELPSGCQIGDLMPRPAVGVAS